MSQRKNRQSICSPPLLEALEQQAAECGKGSRVRFPGVRHDAPDLLRISDAFILTSVSDAASLTLLEAMATALPVIVTNVGGNPEIVRDRIDGFLVPSQNISAISQGILQILTDPVSPVRWAPAAGGAL